MTEKSQRSMPSAKELDEGYLLSLAFLAPFALGAITYELYRKYIADKKVSAAEVVVSENSSDMDTFHMCFSRRCDFLIWGKLI